MKFPGIRDIEKITSLKTTRDHKLLMVCELLNRSIPNYNWVGFYIADQHKKELVLGPFVGTPTQHVRIPFGRGICGRAAERLETIMVQDVTEEDNYLSCSIDARSEIAVPIFKEGRFVAEIDIDSHSVSAFGNSDRNYLENVCQILSQIF